MNIPAEIRLAIFEYLFPENKTIRFEILCPDTPTPVTKTKRSRHGYNKEVLEYILHHDGQLEQRVATSLLFVNRQLYNEFSAAVFDCDISIQLKKLTFQSPFAKNYPGQKPQTYFWARILPLPQLNCIKRLTINLVPSPCWHSFLMHIGLAFADLVEQRSQVNKAPKEVVINLSEPIEIICSLHGVIPEVYYHALRPLVDFIRASERGELHLPQRLMKSCSAFAESSRDRGLIVAFDS